MMDKRLLIDLTDGLHMHASRITEMITELTSLGGKSEPHQANLDEAVGRIKLWCLQFNGVPGRCGAEATREEISQFDVLNRPLSVMELDLGKNFLPMARELRNIRAVHQTACDIAANRKLQFVTRGPWTYEPQRKVDQATLLEWMHYAPYWKLEMDRSTNAIELLENAFHRGDLGVFEYMKYHARLFANREAELALLVSGGNLVALG